MQPSGSSQELWGECFLSKGGKTLQLSQQEREALSWLPKPLLLEGPRLHQPVGGQKPFGHVGHTFTSPKETQIQDEWVLGGIRLLNFKNDLELIHENLTIKRERSGTAFLSSGSPTLEIPQLPPPVQAKGTSIAKSSLFASNIVDDDEEDAQVVIKDEDIKWHQLKSKDVNQRLENTPLSTTVVRQLMHKSVAASSAFYGYDQSTDEALNVLTDVACDFMQQFCQMLRLSRDNQLLGNSTGFADIMERTYRDMNLGSILDLRDFYSNFVVGRYKAIRKECKSLIEKCHNLEDGSTLNVGISAFTPNVSSIDNASVDNIPEIHFPSSEEGDTIITFSLDHHTPQMETGLQMLQSLEQGNYGSLAGGVASSVDEDLQNQQPVSHESTSGIILRTPSPSRKRRQT